MRGVFRDIAFGLTSLAEDLRGTATVVAASFLAGAISLCVWTHIDQAVLGTTLEPIEVGGLYAVTAPPSTPASAVFWSEPISTVTGACRGRLVPAASHLEDRSAWLGQLDWRPRATPAPPPRADAASDDDRETELSPCQLEV